ncbi:CoA-binding domain-containing protein [Mycena venus]|uniref:CoA-binding domain-containing protein n=1 Tax=Mycena venus TaxID=2733690 RepID=A0A8H7DD94_9AGAR|nr:CoA-binding domain-containing protein [Mycena venus]
MLSLVLATLIFVLPGLVSASKVSLLESKTELFLSAPSFAVVGASDDETKFGTIVFKTMLEQGLDVVPINPFVSESQGIPCLDSLSKIVDPVRTSISVVTQPSVTLQILHQASALGIFAVWLQPGAQDAAVLEFIASPNATARGTSYIHSQATAPLARALQTDTAGPCVVGDPSAPDLISTLLARE